MHIRYSGIAIALLGSAWASQAGADTIKHYKPDTQVVTSSSSMKTTVINLSGAGTVELKLTDLLWPEAFEQLSFMVSTSKEKLFVKSSDDDKKGNGHSGWSGTLSFNVSGPTTLYISVYARNGWHKAGAYHLDCNVTPVPLPAAGWLLLSGMAGLAATRRRKSSGIPA